MNRRQFLALTTLSVSAGCMQSLEGSNSSDFRQSEVGGVIAQDVDEAPSDAVVVDATSGRIASHSVLTNVIQQSTTDETEHALVRLSEDQMTEVERIFESMSKYDGDNGLSGYYVRYDQDTVLLYPFYL